MLLINSFMRKIKLVLASLFCILVAGFINAYPQNTQNPQDSRSTQSSQNPQSTQNPQSPQSSQSSQNSQDFSEDPAVFIAQVKEYFANQNNKNTQQILKQFVADWEAGKFTMVVQREVIAVSNAMRRQNIRPHLGYSDYLQALSSFTETTGNSSITSWHKALNRFIDSKQLRPLKAFLNSTTDFNLNHVLFTQNTNSWKFQGSGFNYFYDTTLSIELKDINLISYSGRDSILIDKTTGYYFPLTNQFKGRGGRITWEKYGYSPKDVYAVLNTYQVNVRETGWKADTVNFFHKVFFDRPLLGSMEDRALAGVPLERSTFPKFTSNEYDISIKDLFKDINYRGGFAIEGSRIIGSGNNQTDATIYVQKGNRTLLRLNSKNFVVRPDRLVSQRATATIYHDNDSIYHPGLQLRYLHENREIALIRNGEGVSGSPFSSSFHNIDMFFQGIYYRMGADSVTFEMLRGLNSKGTAIFESANYYSEERFNQLQGIDELNPINVITNYTEKYKVNTFLLPELVEYMRKPYEQVKAMVINMSNGGFLTYYIDNDRIEVKQRLFDYLQARSKKIDYDVIQIMSNVDRGVNGVLDLKTFNITVRGVDSVALSDIKAVNILPRNKEIIIGEDLNFEFNGKVHAGYFTFYSNKSSFDYGKFKLNMPNIDSMSFEVDTLNKTTGKPTRVTVKNVIASLSGELLIDDPANKSGVKKTEVYPLFNSENDSYVYFDSHKIEKGAYKRENFFYTVYPFMLDSLNSFTTKGLKFEGSLNSGDIMPVIEEPLVVMDDFSLGFKKEVPEKGYPVYNDKAIFYSKVQLDNGGLHGNGSLKYLTSTSESDDFMFYPDSLVADLKKFHISETSGDISFPEVTADAVHQYWVPSRDNMSLKTIDEKEFDMFGAKSYHSGELMLTSQGLLGNGKSRLDNADILSNNFAFKNQSFTTDTTDFRLYYPERPSLSLSTRMNAGSVDFTTNQGEFGVEGQSQRIELPHSKYISYMDKIAWAMEESELTLTNSLVDRSKLSDTLDLKQLVDYDFSGSEFMSTDPRRDSLQFFAMEATYRMKENIINAREVKIIRVADVAIFPGDGKVTILSDGDMQPLQGANIIANRKDKFHRIYDADVKINSRKNYIASGTLDYSDDTGHVQQIWFSPVTVDSNGVSYGHASIEGERILPLNDHFNFIGDITMKANNKDLLYDGYFRLVNSCIADNRPWVRFTSTLAANDIRIPISSKMVDNSGAPVLFGIVYSDFFSDIYPTVFERPKAYGDTLIINGEGFIHYDHKNESYIAATNERLDGQSASGNILTMSTGQCILNAEGKIDLGTAMGSVKLESFGNISQYMLVDSTRFNLSLALDFFFSDQAMERLREDVQVTELGSLDANSESFKSFLTYLIGEKESYEFLEELNLTGQVRKMPVSLNKPLVFNNVPMVWDGKLKSFVSDGKIGIAAIQRDLVNRVIDGYIEIGKRRTGDVITIYLELNPLVWYYFSYSNGIMQAISSNNEFNSIISNMKENKRTLGKTSDENAYQYIISTPEARVAFLRKMQQRKNVNSEDTP